MNKIILCFLAISLSFTAALSAPGQAQPFFRTFVSGLGSDDNPCTRTQPCLTFAKALTNTNAGGEIDVLDPGDYGPLVIDKSISIGNDGVGTVGIRALSGGVGITINASLTDVINLRGLTIEGAGIGQTGIVFNTGKALTIQNCISRNFIGDGIHFENSSDSFTNLNISNTFVANNGDNGIFVRTNGNNIVRAVFNRVEVVSNGLSGIFFENSSASLSNLNVSNTFVANNGADGIFVTTKGSGNVIAVFNRVEVVSNDVGIFVHREGTGVIAATAADSVASGNNEAGFLSSGSGGGAVFLVVRSVAASNHTGIEARGAVLAIGQSAVFGNTFGWEVVGSGVLQSYGDNDFNANSTNSGSLTPVAKQ